MKALAIPKIVRIPDEVGVVWDDAVDHKVF